MDEKGEASKTKTKFRLLEDLLIICLIILIVVLIWASTTPDSNNAANRSYLNAKQPANLNELIAYAGNYTLSNPDDSCAHVINRTLKYYCYTISARKNKDIRLCERTDNSVSFVASFYGMKDVSLVGLKDYCYYHYSYYVSFRASDCDPIEDKEMKAACKRAAQY